MLTSMIEGQHMNQTKCPGCGQPISDDHQYCPVCGVSRHGDRVGTVRKEKKRPASKAGSGWWRDLAVVLSAVALFTVGFLILKKPGHLPQPQSEQPTELPGHGDIADMAGVAELPADLEGLVAVGNQQMDDGNFAVAAEAYRRALEIDPSSVNVRTDYGACLYGMGLPERAIEEFRITLVNDPRHAIALFNMGIVFHDLGQADSAKVYWQRCLEVDPNGSSAPAARQLLDSLEG
jgi:cytochrome c-type biogenesis protein CcmH/NrfG